MKNKKQIISEQFKLSTGYTPNIDNPKSYNEKIQWLKLYYRDTLMTACSDKYLVRDFVKKTIGKEYLIPLLKVFKNENEIDFSKLPDQFVLKVNEGSGKNIICKDKKSLNIDETKARLNAWLKKSSNHYNYSFEWAYKNIKPKIICEKYIEQSDKDLYDYKIYCFHGKAHFIRTFRQRFVNIQKNTYDTNWQPLAFSMDIPNSPTQIPKPKKLKLMLSLAERLSGRFPLVRVDLYNISGKIYFGEMTFYPGNGMNPLIPREWDYKLGEYIDINKIIKQRHEQYLKNQHKRKAKIVIYTAISNNYDDLVQHTYVSKDFDYVCFSDKNISNPGIWKIRKLKHSKLDSTRRTRYYKILPHKIFKDYRYSIWIDANINVTTDLLEKRINELITKKEALSVNSHSERNCIYKEARECINYGKDDPYTILRQLNYYKKMGYGHNLGLNEAFIIFRQHNQPAIKQLMRDWWTMLRKYSKRDQLSFNYVLHKNNLKCEKMFSSNPRFLDDFVFNPHNETSIITIYFNSGNGFNDDNYIQKILTLKSGHFCTTFNIKDKLNTSEVSIHFSKNTPLLLNMMVMFKNNDGKTLTKKINELDISTNGKVVNNHMISFIVKNPILTFKIPINIQTIKLEGNMVKIDTIDKISQTESKLNTLKKNLKDVKMELSIYHKHYRNEINFMDADNSIIIDKINTTKSRIEYLKNQLSTIKSSKFFRIWRGFCKLKEKQAS